MVKYIYSPLSKLLYRYAFIPASFVLLTYFFISVKGAFTDPLQIITAAVNILLLAAVNKYYFKAYRDLPLNIIADKEKLIVSGFMDRKRSDAVRYCDIDRITGGVFAYNPKGLIKIHDGRQNIEIVIHPSIENIDNLLKTIIRNVDKELSAELIHKLNRGNRE